MARKRRKTKTVIKSAKTGRFVSKAAEKRWPNRTFRQTVPVKRSGKKK